MCKENSKGTKGNIILLLVLIFFLVFFSSFSTTPYPYFSNFGNKIVVKRLENKITDKPALSLYSLENGGKIIVGNRVIVKVSKEINREQIKRISPEIAHLKKLAGLKNTDYYQFEIGENTDVFRFCLEISQEQGILFAQPDLLQDQKRFQRFQHGPQIRLTKRDLRAIWKKTRGKGINIAVIDDVINLNHEDLRETKLVFQYDLDKKILDTLSGNRTDSHGTKVAGIIFAQHNDFGIDGIAPEAGLIAIRHTGTWTSDTVLSFYIAGLAGADIINCSWNSHFLLEPVADIIKDLVHHGRDGKGILVVFAAGNEGKELTLQTTEASLPDVITVGSGIRGKKRKYSNYGELVDFYVDDVLLTTGDTGYRHFRGTSASAPVISGLLALILSQHPSADIEELTNSLKKDLNGPFQQITRLDKNTGVWLQTDELKVKEGI